MNVCQYHSYQKFWIQRGTFKGSPFIKKNHKLYVLTSKNSERKYTSTDWFLWCTHKFSWNYVLSLTNTTKRWVRNYIFFSKMQYIFQKKFVHGRNYILKYTVYICLLWPFSSEICLNFNLKYGFFHRTRCTDGPTSEPVVSPVQSPVWFFKLCMCSSSWKKMLLC
jgi:hypothetical protein